MALPRYNAPCRACLPLTRFRASTSHHPHRSPGMTPDGVRSMRPDFFSRFFYLVAEGKDDTYLRHRRTKLASAWQGVGEGRRWSGV